jgi:hypothetical protein
VDTPSGGNPLLRTSKKQTSLCHSPCLSVPVFLKNFPIVISDQQLLANFRLMVNPALGMLSAPSLQVKTEPRIDSSIPYATLEEACLVLEPGVLLLPPALRHCWYPLLLEAAIPEWRFCVADSVPVPLSGRDLKAYLIVNPSSVCCVS